ncbi:MAG TPA: hypothetical protein GYA08_10465 [Chloroflexi bacterium]|nr:hypothetical protein [Chloroflexota bacterium]
MSQLDHAVSYTICVEGNVDAALVNWFGPVQISQQRCDDGGALTTLRGEVPDQAALVGLVRHLHGLGIVLLSLVRMEDGEGRNEG